MLELRIYAGPLLVVWGVVCTHPTNILKAKAIPFALGTPPRLGRAQWDIIYILVSMLTAAFSLFWAGVSYWQALQPDLLSHIRLCLYISVILEDRQAIICASLSSPYLYIRGPHTP